MILYFVIILAAFLAWFAVKRKRSNSVLVFYGVMLALLMGLRDASVGTDTAGYCQSYLSYKYVDLWDLIRDNLTFGDANILFYVFNKALSIVFPDTYVPFLLVISIFCSYSLMRLFERFSPDYFLSILISFSLGYVAFFMTGAKQTLAISAGILALINLRDGRSLRFVVWTVVAALFHNSAIVILLAWPAYKLKAGRLYVALVPVVVGLCYVFRSQVAGFFQQYLTGGKYSVYGTSYVSSGNLTGALIQATILAFCLYACYEVLNEDEDMRFFLPIYAIGMVFQVLTPVLAEFFRLSMYFNIVSVVMVPHAIEVWGNRTDKRRAFGLTVLASEVLLSYFVVSDSASLAYVPFFV